MADKKPSDRSGDMQAMQPYLRKVEAILSGGHAMREAGTDYLPRFPQETVADYEVRKRNAKFTNVFRDIVENLAQRPFSKQVQLSDEGLPEQIAELQEDVDGQGNHLHVFAGDMFFAGIASGIDWLLVDYTSGVPAGATVAQEREMGARPYFVRIPASAMLAAYSDIVDGREQFVHVRFMEPVTRRDGWGEKTINRVRVMTRDPVDGGGFGPARFEVWEEQRSTQHGRAEWAVVSEGPITIGVIPLVPFMTGRRKGSSWCYHPPMQDAAELQIELYQQESGLKFIKELTAFPMLAGNGVMPQQESGRIVPVPIGPKGVLYAPPGDGGGHGEWRWIEPSAESLRFLADDIKETARELRELGRQPLTAQSGNLTVVTTAFAAQKGNAAIQAWALGLKDALERAFDLVGLWLRIDFEPAVMINMEFDLGLGDDESFTHILALRQAGEISREAALHEAKRRNILDADYDGEADLAAILTDFEAAPIEAEAE